MLNYIWLGLLVIGFIVGMMSGRIEQVTHAVIDSTRNAVDLSIGLLGIMCLWTGLMKIAEKSGLVQGIARMVRHIINFIFPEVPKRHPARGAIVMNLVANFLGMGNAATPLGLKAMSELQKLNPDKDVATNSMSMFLVLNTSAIQLIPATIIAVRAAAGSSNPSDIIGTIWVTSICSTIVGVTTVKLFIASNRKKTR